MVFPWLLFLILLILPVHANNRLRHVPENGILSKLIQAERYKNYKPHGFLDYNIYQDTREFGVSTLNAKLNLPGPFSYFSLTNWQGNPQGDEAFDMSYLYITEQNLYYNLFDSPFDAHMQYFSISGDNNDALRFGISTGVHKISFLKKFFDKIHAQYNMTYFMWQVDHIDAYAFQLQHVWNIKILPKTLHDRVYINGFADQNFNLGSGNAHDNLVFETQLGVRVYKGLYAVSELRWNGFFPEGSRFGVGIGAEYKINF